MATGRTYTYPIRSLSGLATRPFFQLATPSATAVEIIRIEMGSEDIGASNVECLQLTRRLRNSTIPNVSERTSLNPNDPATQMAATSITNAQGVATAEGSYTGSMMRWCFNTLAGFLYLPTPDERPVMAPSNFYVLQFVSSPVASTWSGTVVVREIT